MAEQGTSHGLGFSNGSLIEYPDGSVEYRPFAKILPVFKVQIRDVVGFSVRRATRDDKKRLNAGLLQQVLTVQGSGTTLAEVALDYGTAEKIEAWFRAHPDFGSAQRVHAKGGSTQPSPSLTVADELMKLAQLKDAGVLTAEEFEVQKRRLLS